MKEFTSQTGGRYTYIDDIMNLQDLALAFSSIFDGCENFIISGCKVTGNSISAGYVYINGKIRYCAGTTGVSKWPMYLYESNKTENVSYVDSGDKIGRKVYGCALASSVPSSNDPLTNKKPQAITIASDGTALRLSDAFFGKYAILSQPSTSTQTVDKTVSFKKMLTDYLQATENISVKKGNSECLLYLDNGDLTLRLDGPNVTKCRLVITKDGAFKFYKSDTLVATISQDGSTFLASIDSDSLRGGSVVISGSDIYNSSTGTDAGVLSINMKGLNGGTANFRNTIIGNGKGVALVTINGKNATISMPAATITALGNALTFKDNTRAADDKTLQTFCKWADKNNKDLAHLGFDSIENQNFRIHNAVGDIQIDNTVRISGELYVEGKKISSQYVASDEYTTGMEGKADADKVYTKDYADKTFAHINKGFAEFIVAAGDGSEGKANLRNSIGAASISDLTKFVQLDSNFEDIGRKGLPDVGDASYAKKLEEKQRILCKNIGAPYKGDVQLKQKDTGWIQLTLLGGSSDKGLHVRQIGNIVCIQGDIQTPHSGNVFELPNSIDPPPFKVGFSHTHRKGWQCEIKGGSRICTVTKCDGGCHNNLGFLITYMV